MAWVKDIFTSVSPWTSQIRIENQSSTPVMVFVCRDPVHPSPKDAIEHSVPANAIYPITTGWMHEPRATLLIRTGIDAAKIVRMPHSSRLIAQLRPHGFELETEEEGIVFEDYADPGEVPGHDTVPMHLRHESFHDRPPAAEMPHSSVAREAAARTPNIVAPRASE